MARTYVVCWLVCVFATLNADVGTFWHVTDFHYDPTYGGQGLSCNAEVSMEEQFGDYWCDSPWQLIENSVNNMAAIKNDVDFILWTGDNVAHLKDQDLSLSANLAILQNITTALTRAFPNTAVYASLGNHDFWPSDQAGVTEVELYRRVAQMWAHWIEDTSQIQLFNKGGYYQKSLSSQMTLLVLNTNLYYKKNKLTSQDDVTDPAGQLAWMTQQLRTARESGSKAMLTAHVPPGLKTPGLGDSFHPQYRKPFMDVITEFSDVIVATHFGHDHLDNFKVLQSDDARRAVPQFSAPSVTPWRSKGQGQAAPAHNPAIRLVKYDRSSGVNLDFDQYFMNLTESNRKGHANWTILYTFRDTYGVPDMSATSLTEVFHTMRSHGSTLGQRYCQYSLVSRFEQVCSEEMQAEIYCGGFHDNLDQAKRCVYDVVNTGGNSTPSLAALIFGCVLVVVARV